MIALLHDNPLLLLFLVAGIGYPLGRLKFGKSSLGVAAVLFVGLIIGGVDPGLALPEIIYQLGLVLFVYTLGLGSGAAFFASFRGQGLRDNLFTVAMTAFGGLLAIGAHYVLGQDAALTAGLFAGSLTSTPALAAVLDYVKHTGGHSDPVVGYSIGYPVSVLGMILTIAFLQRLWRTDYAAEIRGIRGAGSDPLYNCTVLVTRSDTAAVSVAELMQRQRWGVIFGRLKRGESTDLVGNATRLAPGDLVTVVGAAEEVRRVTDFLGQAHGDAVDLDRHEIDFRRVFVSNPRVAGHRLRDLDVPRRFGAVITRVGRGDTDLLPHGDTVLELGDRVRVLTRRENMEAINRFFGDSYRALSEIDLLSFSFGLALGTLLGLVPIPLPGGITLRLGLAGGPLIVALVLGAVSHTGPIVWSLPYNANLLLRQVGLVLFLSGIGTRSGFAFFHSLMRGPGLAVAGAALAIAVLTGTLTLWVGHKLLKMPMALLTGVLAGIQTQSATLGFAQQETGSDLPNVGYATVYPAAMVSKIIIAQLLMTILSR